MTIRRLLLLALLSQVAACYTYAEASLDAVAPGTQVRVGLSPQAAARYRDALAADPRTLEGRVTSQEGGDVLLDVVAATRQVGFQFEHLRQTLRLGPQDVTYVEMKTLDRTRTAAGIGIAAAALGAIAWRALGGKTGGDTRPPSGGGTADGRIVVPILGIPFPFP